MYINGLRNFFYTGCPPSRLCLGLGRVSSFTRDALRGITCLKTGRFLFTRNARKGGHVEVWVGLGWVFAVVTNLHINLCIKLYPLLVGMYCSNCLPQTRPNQNLLLRHISRERGPTHSFLCDVKSLFDSFIKPRLVSPDNLR